jgi:transcriptional regulator with XRE-family HTH domain
MQQLSDDFIRLQRLRDARGATWQELAKELGLSYTMIHYVKKGTRSLGIKARRRLREAEMQAGLRSAETAAKVSYADDRDREFAHELLQEMKRRWRRRSADRDEIIIAVRVLFPTKSKEILNWLKKR